MTTPTGIFAGMSTQALQQALSDAQTAYIQLTTGNKGISFSYTQGDGTKSVTYDRTNIPNLLALIRTLQLQLGIVSRSRAPIRPNFR